MKPTITNKFFAKILIIIFPILFILGITWIYVLVSDTNRELEEIKTEYVEAKKEELKNYVDVAFDTIVKTKKLRIVRVKKNIKENVKLASTLMHNLYTKYHDKMPEEELKEMLSDSLRGLNFLDGRGYFFVSKMDGTSVMHGKIKKIEKQNNVKSGLKGAVGVHKAILKTLTKSDEGFTEYYWYKSKDTDARLSKKIAYVMYFKPFDWYFGSGDYVENIEADLQRNLFLMIGKTKREDGGFIFIGKEDGTVVLHPNEKIHGHNILNKKDDNGFEYIKEIIKVSKSGTDGGYVHYIDPYRKVEMMSYVKYEKDWKWIVGTSSDKVTLKKEIAKKQELLKTKLMYIVIILILVFIGSAILVYFLARKFRIKIDKSFNRFESFFKKAAYDNITLDVKSMEYYEFEKLAIHTNELVNKIKKLNIKLEEKVEKRTKELNKTSKKLKNTESMMIENEKMAALGELVAGVSHEINTPVGLSLTGITHFTEISKNLKKLYENDDLSENEFEEFINVSNELAQTITINLKRAAEIIRSFKMVAVDQTNREMREFNLKEYLKEILISLRNKTKRMNIDFDIQCNDMLTINSNPGLISQIITNLIMNSMIHGFEESKKGKIKIIAKKEGTSLFIEFSDDGSGISTENLKKIFEPFYTTKKLKGGSGLGLNIIQKIIIDELHGTIECKSEEGDGTIFYITFPI